MKHSSDLKKMLVILTILKEVIHIQILIIPEEEAILMSEYNFFT